ncbi:uncharacterized protein, partial [Anser cygnoides]|uniref:uncharacterized protein n=1 Tax=Anser cygnoides TaxID=8845 RepID=UPI0034D27F44
PRSPEAARHWGGAGGDTLTQTAPRRGLVPVPLVDWFQFLAGVYRWGGGHQRANGSRGTGGGVKDTLGGGHNTGGPSPGSLPPPPIPVVIKPAGSPLGGGGLPGGGDTTPTRPWRSRPCSCCWRYPGGGRPRGPPPPPPPAELTVDNGGPWGDWGGDDFCPKGSYATGFQLKVEPPQGLFLDDTALNGVRLLCSGGGTATSSEGLWGEWTPPRACGPSSRLASFRLRVEAPRGLRDDTAANSLDGACSDGALLEGGGGQRGGWGNWSRSCPPPPGDLRPPHPGGGPPAQPRRHRPQRRRLLLLRLIPGGAP